MFALFRGDSYDAARLEILGAIEDYLGRQHAQETVDSTKAGASILPNCPTFVNACEGVAGGVFGMFLYDRMQCESAEVRQVSGDPPHKRYTRTNPETLDPAELSESFKVV